MASRFTDTSHRILRTETETTRRILSEVDRTLIETLLLDRGILASPTDSRPTAPPAPAPSTPSAPAGSSPVITINPIVRLALTEVRPGDLITAGYMNSLVEALLSLDRRLAALEGASATPPAPTPDPAPTPTPVPEPEPARAEPAPRIKSAVATVAREEANVVVTGRNIGKDRVTEVLLGRKPIPLTEVNFTSTSQFDFTTETSFVREFDELTVTTDGGKAAATVKFV